MRPFEWKVGDKAITPEGEHVTLIKKVSRWPVDAEYNWNVQLSYPRADVLADFVKFGVYEGNLMPVTMNAQPQSYPHGSRSPEPFWAAHIRKLEAALTEIEDVTQYSPVRSALALDIVTTVHSIAADAISTGTGVEVEG